MNEPLVPPALVLGCNTPHGIGVLSDWIEEQTGHTPEFGTTGWSDGKLSNEGFGSYSYGRGDGSSYGHSDGNGRGRGHGYGSGRGNGYGDGHGYGYGDGRGYGDDYRYVDDDFDDGNGRGDGLGYGYGDGDGKGEGDYSFEDGDGKGNGFWFG